MRLFSLVSIRRVPLVAVATVMLAGAPAVFADPITLPSTGVSVAEYTTAAITALGAVAAVAVGGFAAYAVIRRGLIWLRKGLG